jgi:hypothetical protein
MDEEVIPVGVGGRIKTWRVVLLVNLAGLLGIFVSLFLLPSDTPFWRWAVASGCIVMCINGVAFDVFRKKDRANTPAGSQSETAKNPIFSGYIFWLWFTASSYLALFREGFSGALIVTDIGISLTCVGLILFAKKMVERSSK